MSLAKVQLLNIHPAGFARVDYVQSRILKQSDSPQNVVFLVGRFWLKRKVVWRPLK